MTFFETLHFTAALTALGLGFFVVFTRKGTSRHRLVGRGFVLGMLLVNGAALLSYEDGRPGIFHALALVSLATLIAGVVTIRKGKVAEHAMWMAWTYSGLLAAGAGQLAVLLGLSQNAVYGAIAVTVALAYWTNNIREMPIAAAKRLGAAAPGDRL